MLFLLRRLAEAIILPLGLSLILMLAGIVFRRRWLSAVGVAILYACSIPLATDRLFRSLERNNPPQSIASAPQADAIVVLSGGLFRGITAAGPQFGDSANRYFAGFDLALAGKAKLLVFSAARSDDLAGPTQGDIAKQVAAAHGIAPDRILVTPPVLTTDDEARAVSRLGNIHSVLLVTSAFHMSRAALLFRAQGMTVFPFPTDTRSFGTQAPGPAHLIPGASSLRGSDIALKEYYGLAFYRVRYWRM
jgi:uncharacterized SAM-binding protein YcdF (DUF218 family)